MPADGAAPLPALGWGKERCAARALLMKLWKDIDRIPLYVKGRHRSCGSSSLCA